MGVLQSRFNQAVNRLETRLQRPRLWSKPVDVDVVLTKACTLACTFCKDYDTLGSKRITLENFEKAARQLLPSARQLNICSGGEPYLHNALEDILRIAKSYGVSTWLLSSGTFMPPDRVRIMVREGLVHRHGFSVDGFKAETVEAIRVNASLDKILENIQMLLRFRDEENKQTPYITIRYALMRSNVEELPASLERWGEMGIDVVDCGYLSLANDMDPKESLFYHQDLYQQVRGEAGKMLAHYPRLQLNLPPLVADEQAKQNHPQPCRAPWSFVMIDTNGQILPCYRAFEALSFPKLYDDDGVAFGCIWNSDAYQKLRSSVNNDAEPKYYPYCAQCENRYGWGSEQVHLGDEVWQKVVGKTWLIQPVNHQRKTKKYDSPRHKVEVAL